MTIAAKAARPATNVIKLGAMISQVVFLETKSITFIGAPLLVMVLKLWCFDGSCFLGLAPIEITQRKSVGPDCSGPTRFHLFDLVISPLAKMPE